MPGRVTARTPDARGGRDSVRPGRDAHSTRRRCCLSGHHHGYSREGNNDMTEPAAPGGTISALPPPSANGSTRSPPAPQPPKRGWLQTRITGMRTGLIVGLAALNRGTASPPGSPCRCIRPSRRLARKGEPPMSTAKKRTPDDWMKPLRPPEGVLTDDVLSLRVPSAGDVNTFAGYAAGQDGGLGRCLIPARRGERAT